MLIWWFLCKQAHWCLVCCHFVQFFRDSSDNLTLMNQNWCRFISYFSHLASGGSGWGPRQGDPQTRSLGSGLFPSGTSSPNWSVSADEQEDKCVLRSKRLPNATSGSWQQKRPRGVCCCVARMCSCKRTWAYSREWMKVLSRVLGEVESKRESCRDAPFTAPHYLNWKEYLYQRGDQKLMEAVMHQLSYIKMSAGKRSR